MEIPDGMIVDRDVVSSRRDFEEDVDCGQYIGLQNILTYESIQLTTKRYVYCSKVTQRNLLNR